MKISIGENIKRKSRKHKQALTIKKPITPNINELLKLSLTTFMNSKIEIPTEEKGK